MVMSIGLASFSRGLRRLEKIEWDYVGSMLNYSLVVLDAEAFT